MYISVVSENILKSIKFSLIIILMILAGSELMAQTRLLNIKIIGNRNFSDYWNTTSVIADKGDNLRLSFIAEVRPEGLYSSVYISSCHQVIDQGDTLRNELIFPLEKFLDGNITVRWYLIQPTNLDTMYLNHPGYVTPYAYIPYREIPIKNWNDQRVMDLRSLENYGELFPGTIRLKVELYHGNELVSSGGANSRFKVMNTIDYGGLNDCVYRISYRDRTGSRLLDNVLLFRNLPLIGNPVSFTINWQDHQTMQWIGGNLNTFTAAAAEMLGRPIFKEVDRIPLPELNYFEETDYYLKNAVLDQGYYYSAGGNKIIVSDYYFFLGDYVINEDRVAMFYRDSEPQGFLNGSDLVLECNHNALRIGALSEIMGENITLIRWKERWPTYR